MRGVARCAGKEDPVGGQRAPGVSRYQEGEKGGHLGGVAGGGSGEGGHGAGMDGVSGLDDGGALRLPEHLAQVNHRHRARLDGRRQKRACTHRRQLVRIPCRTVATSQSISHIFSSCDIGVIGCQATTA